MLTLKHRVCSWKGCEDPYFLSSQQECRLPVGLTFHLLPPNDGYWGPEPGEHVCKMIRHFCCGRKKSISLSAAGSMDLKGSHQLTGESLPIFWRHCCVLSVSKTTFTQGLVEGKSVDLIQAFNLCAKDRLHHDLLMQPLWPKIEYRGRMTVKCLVQHKPKGAQNYHVVKMNREKLAQEPTSPQIFCRYAYRVILGLFTKMFLNLKLKLLKKQQCCMLIKWEWWSINP